MASDLDPLIGNWYRDKVEKSQPFEVVSLEEDAGTIEIQHFDGNVEEWELDDWYQRDLESIEAPEDWTGPVEEETPGDLVYMDSDMKPEDWDEPYQEARERTRGPDEDYKGDEWAEKDLGNEEE